MSTQIKFGIGFDYLPDWSYKEAIREIIQNFKDFGEYTETITEEEQYEVMVTLENDYQPKNAEFLRIGNSGKRDDDETIGTHGEGIKMAAMVLLREGFIFRITTGNKEYVATKFQDEYLGEVFGFEVTTYQSFFKEGFTVIYTVPEAEHSIAAENVITDDDILFEDSYYGRIVDKEIGNIYVNGLYVCNIEDLSKAYDFNSSQVELDRDRSVPKTFDLEYYSSKINESEGKFETVHLTGRDYSYVRNMNDDIVKQFHPVYEEVKGKAPEDCIQLVTRQGYKAKPEQREILLRKPIIRKRFVEKLKSLTSKGRKKKPVNVLKSFFDGIQLNPVNRAKADVICEEAKGWVYEK